MTDTKPTSPTCRAMHLGVAKKAMSDATTLAQVIAAKDKAKPLMTKKDAVALRAAFDAAIARVRNLHHNQQPES